MRLIQAERPLLFYGAACTALIAAAVWLMIPVFITFEKTGLVPRFPTAILATGMTLLGFLSLACGLILQTVTLGRLEAKRMIYLSIPAVARPGETAGPGVPDQ